MKSFGKKHIKLCALLVALVTVFLMSGCTNSPDSVEDPLSKYNMGVNSLVPFATTDPSLATPAPTSTPWAPDITEEPLATATPEPQSGYSDLSYGASGDAVSELQGRLKALGYFNGTLDGKYGESTTSAVRLFQTQLGVSVTGIASASMQRMLFASAAPRYNAGVSDAADPYDDLDALDDEADYFNPTSPTKKPTPAPTKKPSATPAGYQTLSRGDKGVSVSDLQRALKELGYYSGNIDGDYGSGTVAAVKRFQKMYDQNQTGVATVSMQRKLFSGDALRYKPPATPKPSPTPNSSQYTLLEWGDSGPAVERLQKRLRTLGYRTAKANGDYDENTADQVAKFQKAIGVAQTGVATAALQKRLYASSAPTYKPSATATPAPYVKLSRGSTGNRVKTLQRRLQELGYFDGEIGGNYLDLTEAAVKKFQKAIGVEQTGIATVSLQKKLFADDAPAYKPKATPTPTPKPSGNYTKLKEGSSGKAVERLQRRLKDLGYYNSKVTGGFGKNTTAAVKLFQKASGLKQTGVATAELQKLLFSDEAPDHKAPKVTPTPTPKYVKLKPQDTGERVKELQRRLKELGYFDGDIGGNYLTKTTNAVKAFQKATGEKQDGIATVALQERLFSDGAPAKGSGSGGLKALQYKDKGDAVYQLQVRLMELGFMDGFGDDEQGTYGTSTRAAVIDAQLARGRDSDGNADLDFMRFIMSDKAYDISPYDFERS